MLLPYACGAFTKLIDALIEFMNKDSFFTSQFWNIYLMHVQK